jgi:phytoene/squalene synthetase
VLLPRHLIRHFHTVYAYCRWADDLADESGGGSRALSLLG